MPAHDLSVGGDVMDRVTRCARRALGEYGCHPGATVRLLNVSENATYLIDDPDAGPSVLRVHRLGYHTPAEIASELAWMDALRAEAGVRTPRVLPAPGVTLVDVSMIGVAGRVYLAGQAGDVAKAQQAMADVLAGVEGRDQGGGPHVGA